jgi:hypothetical protein
MTSHDHNCVSPRDNRCTECNGRGFFCEDNGPAPREFDCEECGGTGEIDDPLHVPLVTVRCIEADFPEEARHVARTRPLQEQRRA